MHQSMGLRPAASSAALALEKGLLPKNPRCAESGDGCGDSMITWRVLSTRSLFRLADDPHRMNTTRSCFSLTALITSSVKISQPLL